MRFGISVPYLGAASGASSAPVGAVAAAGAAVILCISAGVVSRRKLAPKGRILRLFFLNVGAQEIRFQKRERLSLSLTASLALSSFSSSCRELSCGSFCCCWGFYAALVRSVLLLSSLTRINICLWAGDRRTVVTSGRVGSGQVTSRFATRCVFQFLFSAPYAVCVRCCSSAFIVFFFYEKNARFALSKTKGETEKEREN